MLPFSTLQEGDKDRVPTATPGTTEEAPGLNNKKSHFTPLSSCYLWETLDKYHLHLYLQFFSVK